MFPTRYLVFTSILGAEDCDSTLKIRIRHDETDY